VHCGNDAVNLDHWIFEQHSSKGSARPFGVVSFRGLEKAASQAHSRKPKVLEADCDDSKSWVKFVAAPCCSDQLRLRRDIGDEVSRTRRREEVTNLCCGTGTGAAGATLRAMAPLVPTTTTRTIVGAVAFLQALDVRQGRLHHDDICDVRASGGQLCRKRPRATLKSGWMTRGTRHQTDGLRRFSTWRLPCRPRQCAQGGGGRDPGNLRRQSPHSRGL